MSLFSKDPLGFLSKARRKEGSSAILGISDGKNHRGFSWEESWDFWRRDSLGLFAGGFSAPTTGLYHAKETNGLYLCFLEDVVECDD
jgi:hypothetical protein